MMKPVSFGWPFSFVGAASLYTLAMRFYMQSLPLRILQTALFLAIAVMNLAHVHHAPSFWNKTSAGLYLLLFALNTGASWLRFYEVRENALHVWLIFRRIVVPCDQIDDIRPFTTKAGKRVDGVIKILRDGQRDLALQNPENYAGFAEALEARVKPWHFHL